MTVHEDVSIEGKTCVKCPEAAHFAGVDPKKAVYCRTCFIFMVKNKFRSSLSKRRIFKDGEARETLVVYDGTSSAAFLLHQMEDALKQITYKRLMIKPTMLVLVSCSSSSSIRLVEVRVASLKSVLPSTDWLIVHVAAGLGSSILEVKEECQGLDQIDDMNALLASCKTATAQSEVVRILRERTCGLVARSLGIRKVMLPDDGDVLGRTALAQLCLGRGPAVSELTSIFDKRPSGVAFVRPLRDVNAKEIAIVNHLEGYEKSAIRLDDAQKPAASSIHAITSDFVDSLVTEGFKATVTTVLSTASKLHLLGNDVICSMCELSPIETDNLCASCRDLSLEVGEKTLFRKLFSCDNC